MAFGKRPTGVGQEQGTACLVTPGGARRLSSSRSDNALELQQHLTPHPSPVNQKRELGLRLKFRKAL